MVITHMQRMVHRWNKGTDEYLKVNGRMDTKFYGSKFNRGQSYNFCTTLQPNFNPQKILKLG